MGSVLVQDEVTQICRHIRDEDYAFYARAVHYGEPGDWADADLVSDWFRRNLRIFSNVLQLAESPNERTS